MTAGHSLNLSDRFQYQAARHHHIEINFCFRER